MIPKFTTPQAKMIRTLEGIVLVAFNLAMVVVPIVTNALPAPTAVKWAAVVNSAAIAARSLAKGIMAWQAPMMPAVAPADLTSNPPTAPENAALLVPPGPEPLSGQEGLENREQVLRQQVRDLGGTPNA